MRTVFMLSVMALLWTTADSLRAAEPNAARPNIVLVMTDDQGYGDLSVNGNPVLTTPNIDTLARDGATLKRFYVSPVCTPTRANLMTGRYNYRTKAIDTYRGHAMMDPDEVTIAEVLRDGGYATGIFGKWHLGDCYPMRAMDQGFQRSLVNRGGGLAQKSEPLENNRRYTNPILWRDGQQVQTTGYCTDVFFDAAMEFIEESQKAKQPFFVYLAPNAPHGPFHDVPEDLYRKYKAMDLTKVQYGGMKNTDQTARIYAMVENIDQNMGRLFQRLDQLGLAQNTIVIFMCDNGPNGNRYVGPMRGSKSSVQDGGIRSPFFMRWPARLKPGTSSDRIAAHIDMMPTLLDAAGVAPPTGVKLDGRSVLPLLEGKDANWLDREIVIQSHRGEQPSRYHNFAVVTQRWKLVRPSGFGNFEAPAEAPFELYDLPADPKEKHNLAEEHPDIVSQLKANYDRWFDDVSHTRPNNYDPPRIVVGTDHETETALTMQDWQPFGGGTAGENWGTNGKWLLRAPRPATFDVTVIFKAEQSGLATLLAGETILAKQLVESSRDRIELGTVELRSGDIDLMFKLKSQGQELGPYQIIMRRK